LVLGAPIVMATFSTNDWRRLPNCNFQNKFQNK
jgi:hypothetical protein